MKDGKLKKFLLIGVVILLVCSFAFSIYTNYNKNPYRYTKVDITFDENYEYSDPVIEDSTQDDANLIEFDDVVTETIDSKEIESNNEQSIAPFTGGNGAVNSSNLKETIIGIIKIDNLEDLNEMPVSENLYNQLVVSNGVSNTLSSGSDIDMRVCGISEDNEFMCMFITQTSSYYLRGTIVDDRIDYIECNELR